MLKKPFFSIIIPTYARPQELVICLESLIHLGYPPDGFEVIIIDDGSPNPLDDVVSPFQAQLTIQLIRQENSGPASARNLGAHHARGDFLIFIDDDCQIHPNSLNILASYFQVHPEALLGGYTINKLSDNIYSTASQLLLDYLYSYYNSDCDKPSFFTSNNIALSKEKFYQIGGFDTSFPLAAAEDREFCDRWLYKGSKMIYIPEVIVYHSHKLTLRTFCKQHFNYGRGAFCFHKIRAYRSNEQTKEQIKVEPLKFYLNLLRYPFLKKSSQPQILVAILFLMSQVANIAGFFWEKWHQ